MTLPISRRTLLGGAAAGTAIAAAGLSPWWGSDRPGLVVLHRTVRGPDAETYGARHPGAATVALELDVVRQWRASLRQRFAAVGTAVAYAPWAEARILVGLVREEGGTTKLSALGGGRFEVGMRLAGGKVRS